jgi:hypothetical protein
LHWRKWGNSAKIVLLNVFCANVLKWAFVLSNPHLRQCFSVGRSCGNLFTKNCVRFAVQLQKTNKFYDIYSGKKWFSLLLILLCLGCEKTPEQHYQRIVNDMKDYSKQCPITLQQDGDRKMLIDSISVGSN